MIPLESSLVDDHIIHTLIGVLESNPIQSPVLADIESQAREWIDGADGPLQYLLVFLLAATPLLEILVVIPIGVALGLDPLLVAVVAFAGNVAPIYVIVGLFDRLSEWLATRRSGEPSGRSARATRIWNSYGLPGLALLAPVLTGVHLAAALAMGLGARKRSALAWMTASIALWTALITVVSVTGVSVLQGLL